MVPHFEKMLYDNALLLGVYTHWWRLTGNPVARRVVNDLMGWLLREMRTAEGDSPPAWMPIRSTIMAGIGKAPTTPGIGSSSPAASVQGRLLGGRDLS